MMLCNSACFTAGRQLNEVRIACKGGRMFVALLFFVFVLATRIIPAVLEMPRFVLCEMK